MQLNLAEHETRVSTQTYVGAVGHPVQLRPVGVGVKAWPVVVSVLDVANADDRIEAQAVEKPVFKPASHVIEQILADLGPANIETRVRKRSMNAA
jgi:hypothetical protein